MDTALAKCVASQRPVMVSSKPSEATLDRDKASKPLGGRDGPGAVSQLCKQSAEEEFHSQSSSTGGHWLLFQGRFCQTPRPAQVSSSSAGKGRVPQARSLVPAGQPNFRCSECFAVSGSVSLQWRCQLCVRPHRVRDAAHFASSQPSPE